MSLDNPQTGSSYSEIANHNINAVPDASLGDTNYNSRILPRQISTGSLRGTQIVGYGGVKIDGSNNQIVLGSTTNTQGLKQEAIIGRLGTTASDESFGIKVINADGASISFGILPDGYLGMQLVDANGNEVMRVGWLPVASVYGWATATPGNTLEGQV